MKPFFQIFVLLTLLFSPFESDRPARAMEQPAVTIAVSSPSIHAGEMATVTVTLENVPAQGYTSVELTCTYDPTVVEASNIVIGNLFGIDPVTAINGPHDGQFIVAIAGSDGKKAMSRGVVLAFNVRGLQAGHSSLGCQARVSSGENVLTNINSTGGNIIILDNVLTPTIGPTLCDKVQFVADVTVPDGTPFPPGATFMKTWRLKNVGSCTWTTSYQLVFFSGEKMGAPSSTNFSQNVGPGQVVDISIHLTAPSSPGYYRGNWMFRNANGALFGIGAQANRPWWVGIRVSDATATPTGSQTQSPASSTPTSTTVAQRITFDPGQTTASRIGIINPNEMIQYVLSAAQGQVLSIKLTAPANEVAIGVNGPTGLALKPLDPTPTWSTTITTAGDHTISIASVLGNFSKAYTLEVSLTSAATLTIPTPSITPGGSTATQIPDIVYDFAANACAAAWFSGAGQLPCPGVDGDSRGFVLKLNNPTLETGVTDTRPGILTVPQNSQNGYIQGFYPRFRVQSGDRFRSTIGCEGGATNCYLAFRLDYQVGSDSIKTFWGPFLERYDGRTYSADIDLSPLAGQDVRFILTVLSAGTATGDRALWVGPIISRADSSSTPTSEASLTPTVEVSPTFTPTATQTIEGSWLPFETGKYRFRFLYPSNAQLVDGSRDNYARINLPFVPGTNLSQKYLEMIVTDDANPCRSPLATSFIPETSETVIINGLIFLKETGQDGTAGHINKWVAYSTARNDACVSLNFVLRSANPGVFATPPPLYDETAESLVFSQIVSTFTWVLPTDGTGTPMPAVGLLRGNVFASKLVRIEAYDVENNIVGAGWSNPDGSFEFYAASGTNSVVAMASGYLSAQRSVTVTDGSTFTLPAITLIAGDIDGNHVIDQFDAMTIGMSYNAATPSDADLNNDGIINVLDLELLAKNYRKIGPVSW